MFVAPKLAGNQALRVLLKLGRFHVNISADNDGAEEITLFRLRDSAPPTDTSRCFDEMVDDATSKARYRFTIQQLRILAIKLQLPHDGIITSAGDRVGRVEALAMVCRRLSEASKLLTVASEFGRSTAAYSRIVSATHKDILYFHEFLIKTRIEDYCTTIHAAGSPIQSCWGFIDGTKQYISRPSAREKSNIPNENLQRSVFNGHPRRHCFNWQSIQAPDGIIVS
ncbi:hypothetical protein PHMEG_00031054, partial [Phytophthora megakarya]